MLGFQPLGYPPSGSGLPVVFPVPIVTPDQSEVLRASRLFMLTFLPLGFQIVRGQDNRVSETAALDYAVMTPILRERFATNVDEDFDCLFEGSIAGTILTVSSVTYGELAIGRSVFGVGVVAGTRITGVVDNLYGPGIYVVSASQIVSERKLASGRHDASYSTVMTVQVDVHGPAAADNAQAITTAFRDDYAALWFSETHPAVAPLYAADPRQVPFLNAEQQFEDRWAIDIKMQINPVVSLPQQFADELIATPVSLQAAYPARS